jgi:hypothetical protein
MMIRVMILFFLLSGLTTTAQTVLLNEDKSTETPETERGPNLKKFSHIYMRMAFLASEDKPGAKIKYGSSVNFAIGVRKKFKISPVYSMGFEIEYEYTDYKMKQSQDKIVPDTIINNISQRLDYSSIALGFFNRINFDPHRGNFMGTFLDLGIAGEFHYSINSISKNELPDGTNQKVVGGNLNFTNNTNAKAYARFGFSHMAIFGSYRLAELFKSSYGYPDMPRVILGIDVSFYR